MMEMLLDIAIEQAELLPKRQMSMFRQCVDEILDHRSQPSDDLQIVGTAGADFTKRKPDEVFPIRGSTNHSQLTGPIRYFVGAQVTPAHRAKHAVELVDRKN